MTAPHILVVDDEADIRDLLKEILSEEGYEVDVAADAAEARLCRDENDVDLVLLEKVAPMGTKFGSSCRKSKFIRNLSASEEPFSFHALPSSGPS